MLTLEEKKNRRKQRTRTRLKSVSDRFRLTVFRSNLHIYAQIVDDSKRETLVAASSLELKGELEHGGNCKAAEKVGSLLAQKAVKKGIKDVYFDRGAFLFHGRIKALAEAARNNGLNF